MRVSTWGQCKRSPQISRQVLIPQTTHQSSNDIHFENDKISSRKRFERGAIKLAATQRNLQVVTTLYCINTRVHSAWHIINKGSENERAMILLTKELLWNDKRDSLRYMLLVLRKGLGMIEC